MQRPMQPLQMNYMYAVLPSYCLPVLPDDARLILAMLRLARFLRDIADWFQNIRKTTVLIAGAPQ